jgi:hypothetical protein
VPAAQFIFHILPQTIDTELVFGVGWICVATAGVLHIMGQLILGALR